MYGSDDDESSSSKNDENVDATYQPKAKKVTKKKFKHGYLQLNRLTSYHDISQSESVHSDKSTEKIQ